MKSAIETGHDVKTAKGDSGRNLNDLLKGPVFRAGPTDMRRSTTRILPEKINRQRAGGKADDQAIGPRLGIVERCRPAKAALRPKRAGKAANRVVLVPPGSSWFPPAYRPSSWAGTLRVNSRPFELRRTLGHKGHHGFLHVGRGDEIGSAPRSSAIRVRLLRPSP